MAERQRLNRKSQEISPEIVRTIARIEVFSAVVHDAGLDTARDFYVDNEALIVPNSVDSFAERTGVPIKQARRSAAITLFERDKRIAERYDQGIAIGVQTYFLGDLIAEERGKLYELRRQQD